MNPSRTLFSALLLASGALFPYAQTSAQTPAPTGPHIGSCPVFPKDNIWNTPIDKLPKHPKSDQYIQAIGDKKVHNDFASEAIYGIPYTEVPAGTPAAKVTFEYASESDQIDYPIPANALVEGGPKATGDSHIILIDTRKCILYELFDVHKQPNGTWRAGSGAHFDLNSNDLRKSGDTSADAAGLPIFPGLVRYDEVAAGEIDHALRFTITPTQNAFVWPARHEASKNDDQSVAPLGMRFRLRADYDISNFSRSNRVILKALKRYGMFLADNGSSVFLSGAPDKRWNDDDLHTLNRLKASDFEAVDESDLQKADNSAAVDPAALKPAAAKP